MLGGWFTENLLQDSWRSRGGRYGGGAWLSRADVICVSLWIWRPLSLVFSVILDRNLRCYILTHLLRIQSSLKISRHARVRYGWNKFFSIFVLSSCWIWLCLVIRFFFWSYARMRWMIFLVIFCVSGIRVIVMVFIIFLGIRMLIWFRFIISFLLIGLSALWLLFIFGLLFAFGFLFAFGLFIKNATESVCKIFSLFWKGIMF